MSRAQCLVVRENRILMVKHRQDGEEWWCLPGGGIEQGELPDVAAVRELREECCVEGRLLKLTSMVNYGEGDHHYTYHVEIGDQEPALGDDPDKEEGKKILAGIAWLSLDDLAERDRAYLWTAGILTIGTFAEDLLTWDREPTPPPR
jgi:8-oxo-dGTP diphosphatase